MIKKFCSLARPSKLNEVIEKSLNDVKPFSAIPGPKGIFGIGNFYNYFKIFGSKYNLFELHHNGMKNYLEYGPLVYEKFYPGVNIVHLFDPDDIKRLYTADGPNNLPRRLSHMALIKYRCERKETYRTPGLIPTNGQDWWKIRSEAQKDISTTKSVRNGLSQVDQIIDDFINVMPVILDKNGIVNDMTKELNRLNLELLGEIVFGERFGSLKPEARVSTSLPSEIIETIMIINELTLPLDREIFWRLFDTQNYKKFKQANLKLEKFSTDIIKKKIKSEIHGSSIIEQLFQRPGLDIKDVNGMAADLFLAGIDTTSLTTAFALYHISNNPRVQDLIFQESLKALPSPKDPVTANVMNSEISYLRAVFKEVLRLNPISIGVGRLTNTDMIFSGFLVPKNTICVTSNYVACRLEKYFYDPLKFIPERWINVEEKKKIHPYLVLPFGHGMRSCIARRFAEQNMLVTLLKIIRNYQVQWHGTEKSLDVVTKLINHPKDKVRLKFVKRTSLGR